MHWPCAAHFERPSHSRSLVGTATAFYAGLFSRSAATSSLTTSDHQGRSKGARRHRRLARAMEAANFKSSPEVTAKLCGACICTRVAFRTFARFLSFALGRWAGGMGIITFVFRVRPVARASMPKPQYRSCSQSIPSPEHPCPNHNIVLVPRAYDNQSIHAQARISFLFPVHPVT